MDRETLNQQIVSVRDGAAHLLEQLADATKTTKTPAVAAARGGTQGEAAARSMRPVRDIGSRRGTTRARTLRQADKLRTAKTMKKTHRRRGRG